MQSVHFKRSHFKVPEKQPTCFVCFFVFGTRHLSPLNTHISHNKRISRDRFRLFNNHTKFLTRLRAA